MSDWHEYRKSGWFYRMRVERHKGGVNVFIQRKKPSKGYPDWANWEVVPFGLAEADTLKELL